MEEKHHIIKSSAGLGFLTLISRILGLIRDMTWAAFLGTKLAGDAFVIAFTIPNLFRALLGEGALNGAFVPIFTKELTKKGKKEAFHIANLTATALFLILAGIIFIVLIILFILEKFYADNMTAILTIELTKIMIPYVGYVCLTGLMMGMLNSLRQFIIPGLSPIILNLVFIISIFTFIPVLFGSTTIEKAFGLSVSVIVAGTAQFFLQFFTLKKYDFTLKPAFGFNNPAVKKIFLLALPIILAHSITQITFLIGRLLCMALGEGAASYLYYSTRLVSLPFGIFSVSIATVMLPLMSKYNALKKFEDTKKTFINALRIILFISIPATVGLLILGDSIIQLLFERKEFTPLSTLETYYTLIFLSLGLSSICAVKIVITAYHSLQDTKTPVKIGLISLVINIILNLILMWPLKQGGLALASSISSLFYFTALLKLFEKKLGKLNYASIFEAVKLSLLFALIMGLVCYLIKIQLMNFFIRDDIIARLTIVFGPCLAGIVTVILLAHIFKVKELNYIYQIFLKRLAR